MAGAVPENVIVMWPGTNSGIPDGWSRADKLDSKMTKGVADASTDGGTDAGNSTHTHASASHTHTEPSHTHNGTSNVQVGGTYYITNGNFGNVASGHVHTHSFTTGAVAGPTSGGHDESWGTSAMEPPYYEVIYISSDGDGDGFPDDCIVYYDNATDPDNWTQHSASVDKYFRGATAGGNGGGTGGNATHQHQIGAHTHSIGNHTHGAGNVGGPSNRMATGNTFQYASHAGTTPYHTTSSTNASGSGNSGARSGGDSATHDNDDILTIKMNAIQNDSGASVWLENAYCLWIGAIGDIPDSFTIADGNNSTRNLLTRFILNEPANNSGHGDTSGSLAHGHTTAGHTHTASHSHSGVSLADQNTIDGYNVNTTSGQHACRQHDHNAANTAGNDPGLATTSPTLTDNSNAEPSHVGVVYIVSGEEPAGSTTSAIAFGANF